MRISDWSSDVCSSDLIAGGRHTSAPIIALPLQRRERDFGFIDLARSLFRLYPRRSVVGLVLMSAQAFFYNAIFFTYALVLGTFFVVPADRIGLYILPFAAGTFLGPLLLGGLFERIARRPMISFTYPLSGVCLCITASL